MPMYSRFKLTNFEFERHKSVQAANDSLAKETVSQLLQEMDGGGA
jgi:hypothetical protein